MATGAWRRICIVLLALCVVAVGGRAFAEVPVRFTASPAVSTHRVGELVYLRVNAVLAQGWHIYSVVPTPPPGPIATSISVSSGGKSAGPVAETRPISRMDPNFGKQIAYHEHAATFTLPIKPDDRPDRSVALKAAIHYQVCNASLCMPPADWKASLAVPGEAGAPRSEYVKAAAFAPPVAPASSPVKLDSPSSALLPFLATAFAAGILALLTPCVFPLIPVTIGFFTKQVGDNNPRKLVRLAAAYAVGIIVSFTALGSIFAAVLGPAGPSRVAASPWFNLSFGLLFVVLALSFFEALSINLPAPLRRMAQPVAGTGGMVGVLLMGLAFVAATFTCVAPFTATVLSLAASATSATAWLPPIAGMLCFGAAIALPFFVLALFPRLLTRLPKSGGWLTRFKATLGFVELALAITYFSKADNVWQASILTRPVVLALWAFTGFACALYLVGLLRVSRYPEPVERISPLRIVLAALFLAAGVYCLFGVTGRRLSPSLAAYLPPADYHPGSISSAAAEDGLSWVADYPTALAKARAAGKPLFIDFTGYTCTNCRAVELNIFPQEPVHSLLGQFVLARLYTDGGSGARENQHLQETTFGTVALPLYAIVAADGRLVNRLGGNQTSVARFASFLQSGLAGTGASAASAAAPAWRPFSASAYEEASAAGKPILIDFSAAWCLPCHKLEKAVLENGTLGAKLSSFTLLKADLTNFDSPESAALEKKFSVPSLPAVVIIAPSGHEVAGARVTGLIGVADFESRLDKALASTR